jgi:hypothetical protein
MENVTNSSDRQLQSHGLTSSGTAARTMATFSGVRTVRGLTGGRFFLADCLSEILYPPFYRVFRWHTGVAMNIKMSAVQTTFFTIDTLF